MTMLEEEEGKKKKWEGSSILVITKKKVNLKKIDYCYRYGILVWHLGRAARTTT